MFYIYIFICFQAYYVAWYLNISISFELSFFTIHCCISMTFGHRTPIENYLCLRIQLSLITRSSSFARQLVSKQMWKKIIVNSITVLLTNCFVQLNFHFHDPPWFLLLIDTWTTTSFPGFSLFLRERALLRLVTWKRVSINFSLGVGPPLNFVDWTMKCYLG